MSISLLAGKPAPKELLVDPGQLEREYYERRPDLANPNQMVSFGTSGHRGSPLHGSFTEGRAEGNWSWRCTEELLSAADFPWLRDLTTSSNRLRMIPNPAIEIVQAAL
jgi:hypothetical protein